MREHDFEPIEGLPETLPEGEVILWQGRPRWRSLALRAFHVRAMAVYLSLLLIWHAFNGLNAGRPIFEVAGALLIPVLVATFGVALVAGMAWMTARSTIYTITNHRIVLRSGVAIPMSINIPFKVIGSAAFKKHADGTGDIPIQTIGSDRIAYLHLWPNARPWRYSKPEPMIRSIPGVERVSEMLGRALRQEALVVQHQRRHPAVEESRAAGYYADGAMIAAE